LGEENRKCGQFTGYPLLEYRIDLGIFLRWISDKGAAFVTRQPGWVWLGKHAKGIAFMARADEKYDVVVIGAGIAGASIARELSRYDLSVAILEKEADVSLGATKGTHAIVHCGIPGEGTPLRNRGELTGNLTMEEVCRELDVPYKQIGKLLVGFNEEELTALKGIETATREHGVSGVELIQDRGRLKEMEPNLSDRIIAALYTPTTGVASPWSLAIALMENAVENGARLHVNTPVVDIKKTPEDDFLLDTTEGTFKASYVVNATGAYAHRIARIMGDESFTVKGIRYQRIIMDKKCGGMVRHLVRGLKGTSPTGDFACPTVDGNIMVGCKVEEVDDPEDVRTTREGLFDWVIPQYQKMIPALPVDNTIKPFAAVLPLAGLEFHIAPSPDSPKFMNVVLGVSGFTASGVMAKYLVEEVMTMAGLRLVEKPGFNSRRKGIPHFSMLENEERAQLISRNPSCGHIVCRCETVSEGEIVEAIRRGATTRDGVKFRTRAGMGRCQSNFCGHKVLEILSRELGVSPKEISRKGPGSEELF